MNLKNEIKKLIKLQEIDKEIYQLDLQKNNNIPKKITELKELIDQKQKEFAAFKDKVNRLELEKKNKEGELAQKEENLKKTKSQLYQLKSNKEYQLKLNEISSIEADISCAEEEVIKFLDTIEQEKAKVEKEKESTEAESNKIKQEIDSLEKQTKEIGQQIKELENKRNNSVDDVDEKILNQYQELLKKRSGLAIVPVINDNCGACHMSLTSQKINEIKMYDRLVLCESCVRILYIPEDLKL
ncbi:MAG: C4-type zinc ribbon domain-containing protein [Candidatus Omnitrophota bacterium]